MFDHPGSHDLPLRTEVLQQGHLVGGPDIKVFLARVRTRLPTYRERFIEAGETYGIDWRLLAAQAYQESHWNYRAKSPTGVRGIMMLTQDTARRMGVTKRLDPTESINGGARYLSGILEGLPDEIEPAATSTKRKRVYGIALVRSLARRVRTGALTKPKATAICEVSRQTAAVSASRRRKRRNSRCASAFLFD